IMAAARSRSSYDVPRATPRSAAYTGLLILSLLAQLAGAVFLYLDWKDYPENKPKHVQLPRTAGAPAPAPAGAPSGPPVPPGPRRAHGQPAWLVWRGWQGWLVARRRPELRGNRRSREFGRQSECEPAARSATTRTVAERAASVYHAEDEGREFHPWGGFACRPG